MSRGASGQVHDLLAQAEVLLDGPTKVALAEKAVRLADAQGDPPLGFQARLGLITAAIFSGAPEKALVAFAWCLGHSERDPHRFPIDDLLWTYKWVVNHMTCFPQIGRQQILDTLDHLEAHYRRADRGARVVAMLRCHIFHDLGEPEQARAAYRCWMDAPRDRLSDCLACERDQQALYLIGWGQHEHALEWVAPILNGQMRCRQIPHRTLARVLWPMVQLDQLESAMQCHQRGYRLVARNPVFLSQVGEHLRFLALTDNLTRGLSLFQSHLGWALRTSNQAECFDFLLAARFLFDRQERTTTTRQWSLRLPAHFPLYQPQGVYEAAALAAWLEERLDSLATSFDARNQNSQYRQRIAQRQTWEQWIRPFPITTSGG